MVADVAKRYAQEVDRAGRFPIEAITELKRLGLLSIAVNFRYDKDKLISVVMEICETLAQSCPSTAMIFGMHTLCVIQISVHGGRWHQDFLSLLHKHQYLVASATSEDGIGGATVESFCHIVKNTNEFVINKKSSVMSYGAEADAILVTAKRSLHSSANQQALALCLTKDSEIIIRRPWDALGMRGTCSHAFDLQLIGDNQQIFAEDFAVILEKTGIATTHLIWSSVWLGIALDAYNKSRSLVKSRRRRNDKNDLFSNKLFQNYSKISMLKSAVSNATATYLHRDRNLLKMSTTDVLDVNSLKIRVSEDATNIVISSMEICGLHGYLIGNEYSVSQNLRDIFSSKFMISNARLEQNMSPLCMIGNLEHLR